MDRPIIIHPRFSPGQRVIAVSDIHGNLPFFRALMEKIHLTSQDVLVLVGDMIEKGADRLALLRYLMDFSATPAFYPLCGNCDGLVLRFFETAALDGAAVTTEGLLLWTEELVDFADDSSYDTHALRLSTSSFDSRYTIALPEPSDFEGGSLCLDVCDRREYAVEQGDYALLDFTVELTDAEGRTASARAGDFAAIFQVLPVRTDKLDYVFQNCTYKTSFATVTIPTEDFEAQEGFDWSAVTDLSLVFDRSLDLMIDNIGLNR